MKIVWITGDWALDTDLPIVPYLRDTLKLDIKWYVISGSTSKVQIPMGIVDKVYRLTYRNRELKCANQYYKFFKDMEVSKADIIYSSNIGLSYYYPMLLLAKDKKTPIIHAAHNVIPYPVWPMSLKIAVKTIFHFNHHFQLFSKFTADYFMEHYPNKSMFYAPMTVKDFGTVTTNNYTIDTSKVNLLFFGNVVANKRLDLLIEAVKGLPEDIMQKVHLNIYGKCKETERYIKLIDGCENITTYFKRIDDCEIPELFSHHNFFMLPYQDVAQSGPHMIAYNYNLPVIASDIDGFAERIEDKKNGFLFKRNDVESLKHVIIKAVNLSEEEYSQMKKNLANYTEENFSVPNIARKYVDYFNYIKY